jgi:hypothetical protein
MMESIILNKVKRMEIYSINILRTFYRQDFLDTRYIASSFDKSLPIWPAAPHATVEFSAG